MQKKKQFSEKEYRKKNPKKDNNIIMAVKKAVKDYGETFRKLATT